MDYENATPQPGIGSAPQPGKEPNTVTIPNAVVTTKTTSGFYGLSGFNMKTPENARNFFNLFLTFATILNIVVAGFQQMPSQVKLYVLESSSVLVLIVKQVEGMFGVANTSK